MLVFVV